MIKNYKPGDIVTNTKNNKIAVLYGYSEIKINDMPHYYACDTSLNLAIIPNNEIKSIVKEKDGYEEINQYSLYYNALMQTNRLAAMLMMTFITDKHDLIIMYTAKKLLDDQTLAIERDLAKFILQKIKTRSEHVQNKTQI